MSTASGAGRQRLVGRAEELDALVGLLAVARSGGWAVATVSGEPGIGKTRLLDELAALAHAAGCRVVAGRGLELEREVPFGLVVDALDEPLSATASTVLADLGDEFAAELADVFPSFPERGERRVRGLEVERYRCHRAIRAAVQRLAGEAPVLLVLDDVQWADPASIEAVTHLLRKRVDGVAMVLAFRTHQAPPALRATLMQAVRADEFRSVALPPLSEREAADLLGADGGSSALPRLHAESGGNPFYLEQLARATEGRPTVSSHAPDVAGLPQEVPPVIRMAIEQEIQALSTPAQVLLRACAVVGEPFDVELVAEVADLDDTAVGRAVDELINAELVRPAVDPGRLQFRHPVTRRAVYDGAGFGWRRYAHRRAVDALSARGAAIGTLAHHVERSAVAGDRDAITLLTGAGEASVARAPAAAGTWFSAALRLLPDDAEPGLRVSLLVQLADVYATTGRLRDGLDVLRDVLGLTPADDPGTRGRIMTRMARLEQLLGRGHEARRLLNVALEQVEPSSADAGALTLELAKNHFSMREWTRAVEAAGRARALAQELEDRGLLVAAAACEAHLGAYVATHESQARRRTAEAAHGLDEIPDDSISPQELEALTELVYAESNFELWEIAELHGERVVRLCRASGNGTMLVETELVLAIGWLVQGRLARARLAIEEIVEASELLNNDHLLATTLSTQCWVLAVRGEIREALDCGARALEAAARVPRSFYPWMAHICHGEALVEAGELDQGRSVILAAGGPELTEVPPQSRPRWHRVLTEVEVALGDFRAAERMAELAEAGATATGRPMRVGDAHLARACVLLATGRPADAVAAGQESVRSYGECGARVDAARARLLVAEAMLAGGTTEGAVHELTLAHSAFDRCGALRYADRSARELRNLGKRSHRPRRAPVRTSRMELTGREVEVVKLVALGYTNREIASELCVSVKTVEAHLTRLYSKVGVSSRARLAALSVTGRTGH